MRSTLSLISTIDSYTLHPLAKLVGWGVETLVNKSLSSTPIAKPLTKFWITSILTYTQKSEAPEADDDAPVRKITYLKNWWASTSLVQRVHAFVSGKSFGPQQCEETAQRIASIAKDCIKLDDDSEDEEAVSRDLFEENTRQISFKEDVKDLLLQKSQQLDAGNLTWSQFVGFSAGYASETISPFIMRWSTLAFTRGFVGSFITSDYSYNPFNWTTLIGTCILSGVSYWFAPSTAPKAAAHAIPTRTLKLIDEETIEKIANKAAINLFGSATVSEDQQEMLDALKVRIAELVRKPVVKKSEPEKKADPAKGKKGDQPPVKQPSETNVVPPPAKGSRVVTKAAPKAVADPTSASKPKADEGQQAARRKPQIDKVGTPPATTPMRMNAVATSATADTILLHPSKTGSGRKQNPYSFESLANDPSLVEAWFQAISAEFKSRKPQGTSQQYLDEQNRLVGQYITSATSEQLFALGRNLFTLQQNLSQLAVRRDISHEWGRGEALAETDSAKSPGKPRTNTIKGAPGRLVEMLAERRGKTPGNGASQPKVVIAGAGPKSVLSSPQKGAVPPIVEDAANLPRAPGWRAFGAKPNSIGGANSNAQVGEVEEEGGYVEAEEEEGYGVAEEEEGYGVADEFGDDGPEEGVDDTSLNLTNMRAVLSPNNLQGTLDSDKKN